MRIKAQPKAQTKAIVVAGHHSSANFLNLKREREKKQGKREKEEKDE